MTEAITEIVATLKADNDRLRAERWKLSSEVQRLRGMTYRNQQARCRRAERGVMA